ncbi:MAG: SPASM domain-containing protein [Candidatus Nanoarchaeia archaeon]|nr:SPASM domain-containing protein [Candidatus Nanoarchaeia archaeon]
MIKSEIYPDIFNSAVEGLKKVISKEKHPNIEIDCTILNENISTLESIVELSKELGGVFIDFDPVQIYGVGNNSNYKFNIDLSSIDKVVSLAEKYNIEITSKERIDLIKKYFKKEKIVVPCYSYCKDLLISPKGEVYTCWTINTIIGNILDASFVEDWRKALVKNKDVLTGHKKECYTCGFSHSRMPDQNYKEYIQEANKIRLDYILSKEKSHF